MEDVEQKVGLEEVVAFLCGEGPLCGQHFGEGPPAGERGNFWWRKYLRAALTTPSAKLAEVERERDEARSQFDHHVVWASDQSVAIEAKLSKAVEALNAAQALATCCMAAGCYSHEELTEMARATRPVFDEALASLTPSAAIERAGE